MHFSKIRVESIPWIWCYELDTFLLSTVTISLTSILNYVNCKDIPTTKCWKPFPIERGLKCDINKISHCEGWQKEYSLLTMVLFFSPDCWTYNIYIITWFDILRQQIRGNLKFCIMSSISALSSERMLLENMSLDGILKLSL